MFAVSSAMALNFSVKFYTLIYTSPYVHMLLTEFNCRKLSWNYRHQSSAT